MERLTVVFYDGECGLCNLWVRFLLSRQPPASWKFAPIQGVEYKGLKARFPLLEKVDSLIAHEKAPDGERIRLRADGVLWLLGQLPGWKWTGVLRVVPGFILDWAYEMVAKRRKWLMKPTCGVFPEGVVKERFLEDPAKLGEDVKV